MTFPTLPGPVPGQIDSDDAYALIAAHGIEGKAEAHPACERIRLKNGAHLTLWYGGGYDDIEPYWTLEGAPAA